MTQPSLFDDADEPVRSHRAAGPPPVPAQGPPVVAATDGSSHLEGGLAAGAWFVSPTCWGALPVTTGGTNQLGELLGLLAVLEAVPAHRPLHVLYDSTYAKACVTDWWAGWSRGGRVPPERWLTSKRLPVLHAPLIERAARLARDRDVTWTWVKGHATAARGGHPLNHEADRVAGAVVAALRSGTSPDLGPGWTG